MPYFGIHSAPKNESEIKYYKHRYIKKNDVSIPLAVTLLWCYLLDIALPRREFITVCEKYAHSDNLISNQYKD
jgi:hypothetical protein